MTRISTTISKGRAGIMLSALMLALTAPPAQAQESAKAELVNAEGKSVGTVAFTQTPDGVLLTAEFSGLPEGTHGFHIHEAGQCEPPFTSAGGHFNPTDAKHGFVDGGPHAGDMPNIHVPESGNITIEVLNTKISLSEGDSSVFDDDGSALLVHAGADDYESQPSGDAGDRVACGVIKGS